jgi:hypothetical protein
LNITAKSISNRSPKQGSILKYKTLSQKICSNMGSILQKFIKPL